MTFLVQLTQQADSDVDVIYNWIATRSPEGATRWYLVFLRALHSLSASASNCGRAPESDFCNADLRQLLLKTRRGNKYRIAFVIRDTIVHVVAVRGTGQDLLRAEDIESFE